jgi:predicted secreted Zn-dependent protease
MKVSVTIPKPSVKSFKIKGETISDARDALNRRHEWGFYSSNQSVDWSGKGVPVDTVKVSAKPVIELPSWSGYPKADKDAQKEWDRMFKALTRHENAHHDVFTGVCDAWKKALEKGGDLAPKDMQDSFDEFMKDVQKAQDKFDASTGNGARDGVELNG